MGELPLAIYKQCLEIIVGVTAFVPWRSVADFKIHNFFRRVIDQPMSVACARLETCAHSRGERAATFVSVQSWVPLKYVDELILLGVRVTQSRNRIRG